MDRIVLVDTLKQHPLELKNLPAEAQDDKELVLAAVKKNGQALQYASERLRNDREIVLTAVKKSGTSLAFASKELKNDEEVVRAAVHADGAALGFVPAAFLKDRQLILDASRHCSAEHIPEEFLGDREIAQKLVSNDAQAFSYLSDELRKDLDLISQAVQQDSTMYMYVPDDVLKDREAVMQLAKKDASILEYIPNELKEDKEIALTAMSGYGCAYGYDALPLRLQKDADILRAFAKGVHPGEEVDFCHFFSSALVPEELLAEEDFVLQVAELYSYADIVPDLHKDLALRMIELGCFNCEVFEDLLEDPDIRKAVEEFM